MTNTNIEAKKFTLSTGNRVEVTIHIRSIELDAHDADGRLADQWTETESWTYELDDYVTPLTGDETLELDEEINAFIERNY